MGKPRPPLAGVPLWQSFAAMSETRTTGEAGPNPLQPREVEAWARLMCVTLFPHHVAIILAMDAAWLEWARTPEKDRVAGPLTAEVFDAIL